MSTLLNIIKTDLIQSKILKNNAELSIFKLFYLFLRSKTCRMHLFVRLRSSNIFLAYIAKKYLDRYLIEIGRNTKIGSNFFMPHPRCIIIADDVVIGNYVHVAQYVTIGGNFRKTKSLNDGNIQKLPIIGDRVMVNPGAVIGGPVTIGDDVIIGANSTITKDVLSNSIAYAQNKLASKKIKISEDCGTFDILD